MDALADELAATVERMREDALRTRLVGSLGQALDLDEVLARCAEAAAALHGVAGATVAVAVDGVALSRRRGSHSGRAGPPRRRRRRRASGRSRVRAVRDLVLNYSGPRAPARRVSPLGGRGPASKNDPRAARLPDRSFVFGYSEDPR
jgi:hypothetical protein